MDRVRDTHEHLVEEAQHVVGSVLAGSISTSWIPVAAATSFTPSWKPSGLTRMPPATPVSWIVNTSEASFPWLCFDVLYRRHSMTTNPSSLIFTIRRR